MLNNAIAVSCGNYVFDFLRNFQLVKEKETEGSQGPALPLPPPPRPAKMRQADSTGEIVRMLYEVLAMV